MRFCVVSALALFALLLLACGDDGDGGSADLGADALPSDSTVSQDAEATDAAAPQDAEATDAAGQPDAALYSLDTQPPDMPTAPQLTIEQIYLAGTQTGESALVVGPDGTSVLIDFGGSSHTDKILETIDRRLGHRNIDWLVSTHYHSDHVGSFHDLVTPSSANGNQPLQITHGLISRGLYDINSLLMLSISPLRSLCTDLGTSTWSGKRFDMCSGPVEAGCSGLESGSPWPASNCDGLLKGNLLDPADDDQGKVSFIELGDGARLYLFHANGHVATSEGVKSAGAAGIDIGHGGTGPENNRSLGGVIRWGDFSYSFHGDLSEDSEQLVTAQQDKITTSPSEGLLVPAGALDVSKLSHHGLSGSTTQAWVDWLYPDDGQDRNAVVGGNDLYILSPASDVLGRVGSRLSNGYVWTTERSPLGGTHSKLREIHGAVVVQVSDGGTHYEVSGLTSSGPSNEESYTSTVP